MIRNRLSVPRDLAGIPLLSTGGKPLKLFERVKKVLLTVVFDIGGEILGLTKCAAYL